MQPRTGGGLLRSIRLTLMDPWQVLGSLGLVAVAVVLAVMMGHLHRPAPHLPKTTSIISAVLSPSASTTTDPTGSPSPQPAPPSVSPSPPYQAINPPTTAGISSTTKPRSTPRPTVRPTPSPTPPPTPTGLVAILHVNPLSGTVRLTAITADAGGSYDGTAAIVSYAFDFGDGTGAGPQPGPEATHAYRTSGVYTVRLTVTDAIGRISTDVAVVTIAP